MIKVAVMSDIHGNMQALEAVLDDIKLENCDKIFCLGDIAMAGPNPLEVTELIKKMSESPDFEIIQGNTDEMIGNYSPKLDAMIKSAFPVMGNALENDIKIMPQELRDFLKNLAKTKEIQVEGFKILLVHGSPRKNNENITPDLTMEQIEEIIKGTDADVIFCGHTHIPCGYQTTTKQTIINDGSVGRPFTPNPKACYVVANFYEKKFDVVHKFIDYNKETASKILEKREFKGADKLAKTLINPEYRHF